MGRPWVGISLARFSALLLLCKCGSIARFPGSHFPSVCKGESSSIFHPRDRKEGQGTKQSGKKGTIICAGNQETHVPLCPHPTSCVILDESPATLSLPSHLCNGWVQFLPLQCGSSEVELVTVLYEPQVCRISGDIMLFLATARSPGSLENLVLQQFAGDSG